MGECKICNDSKHIFKNGMAYDCECLIKQKHFNKLIEAGIEEELIDFTWENIDDKRYKNKDLVKNIKSLSERLCDNQIVPFVLFDKNSFGKSLFVSLIISDLINVKKTCYVVELENLVNATFENDEEKKSLLEKCRDVDFLCIELGYEREHKMNSQTIEKFYRSRKRRKKITAFTSKYDLTELDLRFGESVINMFKERKFKERILKVYIQ